MRPQMKYLPGATVKLYAALASPGVGSSRLSAGGNMYALPEVAGSISTVNPDSFPLSASK